MMMMTMMTPLENVCSRVFSEIQSPARAGPMRRSSKTRVIARNPRTRGKAGCQDSIIVSVHVFTQEARCMSVVKLCAAETPAS